MHLKQIILSSLEYNLWVNEQYDKWLSDKSDVVLTSHVDSSFPSMLLTLQHILQTQEYWWSVLMERQNIAVERQEEDGLNRDQVFDSLIENSRLILNHFNALSEDELLKTLAIKNEWFSCNFSKFEYVQQLMYHAAYHRGQVVTIGRNLGIIDAPLTDYNFWNLYKDRTDIFAGMGN
ncbi:MAG: DinB family protein [Sphingobacterium sp.]|uniref:DinB family protein n=1 Tax=Sphingobacterium sp. JB170 TaxID=1434842 RepID=UPI00097EE9A0|nr:DinB family protein [Sphingobacterium sp. JB170]SJN45130.1 nuclease inhibitor [Sphingobacterium sp. JB170]